MLVLLIEKKCKKPDNECSPGMPCLDCLIQSRIAVIKDETPLLNVRSPWGKENAIRQRALDEDWLHDCLIQFLREYKVMAEFITNLQADRKNKRFKVRNIKQLIRHLFAQYQNIKYESLISYAFDWSKAKETPLVPNYWDRLSNSEWVPFIRKKEKERS